jgi:TPR repeat protein
LDHKDGWQALLAGAMEWDMKLRNVIAGIALMASFIVGCDQIEHEGGIQKADARIDAGHAALINGDYKTAMEKLRPLAEEGVPSAQFMLGNLYTDGYGVSQDYKEAVKWYTLAAEQGYASAQYNLGVMYRQGKGVTQNDKEAVKWTRLAAEQGHSKAQYNLGVMYFTGEVVPQNDKEAVKWYRLAAEQGYAKAQYTLGLSYALGKGVPLNDEEAYAWVSVAAANGSEEATAGRDIVAKELTPAQLAEGQALAAKYFEKYQPKQ